MAEYILRDQAIIAVTGAKLPDMSASGRPIANGKRSVTDCVRRLKSIPAADVQHVVLCRDCEMANHCSDEREMYCTLNHCYKKNNYFCADGKGEK